MPITFDFPYSSVVRSPVASNSLKIRAIGPEAKNEEPQFISTLSRHPSLGISTAAGLKLPVPLSNTHIRTHWMRTAVVHPRFPNSHSGMWTEISITTQEFVRCYRKEGMILHVPPIVL
jgi:hypothetical protein